MTPLYNSLYRTILTDLPLVKKTNPSNVFNAQTIFLMQKLELKG
jgi:hypothetical protein